MGQILGLGLLGKGLPSFQMLTNRLYDGYLDIDGIDNLDRFHNAILDMYNKINSSMLGMHYDAPKYEDMKECFDKWKVETDRQKKKDVFLELMKKVNLSKTNTSILLAGVAAPPSAMILKRAGENVPQINKIKLIPDFLFVPTATVLTLFSVKFIQNNALKTSNTSTNPKNGSNK